MNKNPNQPKKFDAVLGGQDPPPVTGVVLGGLEVDRGCSVQRYIALHE